MTNLLGQFQTVLGLIDHLAVDCRKSVKATFAAHGVDVAVLARQTVKAKHALQCIPHNAFEPMAVISTGHLNLTAREAIDAGQHRSWGVVCYANDYGCFLCVGRDTMPTADALQSIQTVYRWALAHDLQWLKLDCDAAVIPDLPYYGDGEVALASTETSTSVPMLGCSPFTHARRQLSQL